MEGWERQAGGDIQRKISFLFRISFITANPYLAESYTFEKFRTNPNTDTWGHVSNLDFVGTLQGRGRRNVQKRFDYVVVMVVNQGDHV